jgi:hypothetical protein
MINTNNAKLISVCISTYEMHGLGYNFLKNNFDILVEQKFKDFDVVISDNSIDTKIQELCVEYEDRLDIHYFKNQDLQKGMSTNINNAIKNATGRIVKILFLDDFLYDDTSLEIISKNFDLNKDKWLVTSCEHTLDGKTFIRTFHPKYNSKIHLGKNTIGSPTVLAIKNEDPLFFDTNLKWLMDCDYHKRYYLKFGEPKIINDITVVIRSGEHQATNTEATLDLRYKEYLYVLKKYEKGLKYWKLLIEGYSEHIARKILNKYGKN